MKPPLTSNPHTVHGIFPLLSSTATQLRLLYGTYATTSQSPRLVHIVWYADLTYFVPYVYKNRMPSVLHCIMVHCN